MSSLKSWAKSACIEFQMCVIIERRLKYEIERKKKLCGGDDKVSKKELKLLDV